MITMTWWQLALCLYLAFNLGFALRQFHDQMYMDPVWPHAHRYTWWEIVRECAFWLIFVILPLSLWGLTDALGKRTRVELRMRKRARRV